MQRCWLEDSEERPSFTDLSSIMDAMLSSVSDYAELNMKLPHNSQDPIIGDQLMVVTVLLVCISLYQDSITVKTYPSLHSMHFYLLVGPAPL